MLIRESAATRSAPASRAKRVDAPLPVILAAFRTNLPSASHRFVLSKPQARRAHPTLRSCPLFFSVSPCVIPNKLGCVSGTRLIAMRRNSQRLAI